MPDESLWSVSLALSGRQDESWLWPTPFFLDYHERRYFDFVGIFWGRAVYRERPPPCPRAAEVRGEGARLGPVGAPGIG